MLKKKLLSLEFNEVRLLGTFWEQTFLLPPSLIFSVLAFFALNFLAFMDYFVITCIDDPEVGSSSLVPFWSNKN